MHGHLSLRFIWFPIYLLGLILDVGGSLYAQAPKTADNRLAVDVVKLKTGLKLLGFVLGETQGKLNMAVDRTWFKDTHPRPYKDYYEREKAAKTQAASQLKDRINQWIADRSSDAALVAFLNDELAVLESTTDTATTEDDVADAPRFLLIELTRDEIREITIQTGMQRKIGGLAYQYRLASPATTPANTLEKQLESKGIDLQAAQVDISGEVPFAMVDSTRQWAARRALVEYVMREPLEYQGTGTQFIRKSESVDVADLMAQFAGGSGLDSISALGAELGLPEFKKPKPNADWWQSICKSAEKDGYRGVLVTRLDQNQLAATVVVEVFFFAMESPNNWFEVQRFRATADANTQAGETLERLKNDPQIKGVLDAVQGLGIGDASLLDRALKHGAATQEAMQSATSQFHLFKSRHTRSLRTPPIETVGR